VALGGFYYYHSGQAPFTVDLSDKPLLFKASVELKDGGATLLFHDTRLRIESLGEIVAGGSANLSEHGAISIFAQITNLDSNTLFTKLLADNYSGNYEFLENLKVSGTVTSGGVLLQGPLDALRITGRVALSGFGVSYKDFVVENLNADIPVDVAVTGVSKGGDQPHEGVITFSRFGVGAAQIVNKRLPFHATGDAMVFDESIAFDVPGGRLTTRQFRIENISLSQIHGHETRFRFSDFLGDLDLALLTKTLGWKQMDGAVKVRLGNIVLDGEEMSTEGTIDMAAFGGDIAFSKLSASSVFRGPAIILFSADINNVSLSNISHTFGFGEISGTLSGKITDFEYVLGTANGFEIDLEVVKGEGQFVRPEFLRDFMFVNTGRVLDLPRNVLVALGTSRSYAYKEFGIHAILKNNILTLGSKYKYQGQEAYMTAPWYGGVNIINENPGRQYRWKPIYTRISNVLSGKGKVKINQ
jgi:hypothetical protein